MAAAVRVYVGVDGCTVSRDADPPSHVLHVTQGAGIVLMSGGFHTIHGGSSTPISSKTTASSSCSGSPFPCASKRKDQERLILGWGGVGVSVSISHGFKIATEVHVLSLIHI